MKLLFEYLYGDQLRKATAEHLKTVVETEIKASRRRADALLASLQCSPGPKITIGRTPWGAEVMVPLSDIVGAHGVISGATGTGKTRVALQVAKAKLEAIIEALITNACNPGGIGELDCKGDLFHGTLFLLQKALEQVERTHPRVAEELRKRVSILDFSCQDPITSYGMLVPWPDAEPTFFARSRTDVLASRGGFGFERPNTGETNDWLTPPALVSLLGSFDLDPCGCPLSPYRLARSVYFPPQDGLILPWQGRVFCNPPYGPHVSTWVRRMANHGNGILLIFSRVETKAWEDVWRTGDAFLFPFSRISFRRADGERVRSGTAPSALIAFGAQNAHALSECHIAGALIRRAGILGGVRVSSL